MSFYHGNEPGQTPGLLPDPYYCMFKQGYVTCTFQHANRFDIQGGRPARSWAP